MVLISFDMIEIIRLLEACFTMAHKCSIFFFSSQVCCTLYYKIESSKIRRLQKMHFKAPLLATVYCCTRRTVCPCCIDFKIREVHTAQMHLGVISMKLTHAHVYKSNACSRLDGTREDGRSLRMVVHTYLHVYLLILLNISISGSVLTSSQAFKIKS